MRARLALLLIAAAGAAAQAPPDILTKVLRRLDLIDVDSLLNNKRILTSYVRCLLHTGNCAPEARDFRRVTPYFIRTRCGTCTESQKEHFRHIYRFVRDKHPDYWNKLLEYYDPNNKYRQKLIAFMEQNPSNLTS